VTDENPKRKTIEAGVTSMALEFHDLAKLALSVTQENGYPDQLDDRGKLVFLSMMSHSISHILSKQNGCKEISRIWAELTMALSDVADGKTAKLFRPLKEEDAQPRRMPVYREMYFSIFAGVYDLAKGEEKEKVEIAISRKLKVKRSQLKDFRKNLTRSMPNIKSGEAIEIYDSVYLGHLCVDDKGQVMLGTGKASPVANWLKWFDNLTFIEV